MTMVKGVGSKGGSLSLSQLPIRASPLTPSSRCKQSQQSFKKKLKENREGEYMRLILLCKQLGFIPALLLSSIFAWNLFAQEVTGSIVGLVKDSNGAAVAGAKVTIREADKNITVRTLTTDSDGAYSAPLLPVGHYAVTI